MSAARLFFEVTGTFALAYFALQNLNHLVLVAMAWPRVTRHLRLRPYETARDTLVSPLTPPVSVLVPSFNEEAGIVASVQSLLSLEYPEHEVVVLNDGSTDATLALLVEAFDLVPVRKALRNTLPTAPVRGAYLSRRHPNLWVIDKVNGGSKADALNCGLNAARYPYVCAVDADGLLERDALLRIMRVIVEDPDRVVAAGGIVRVINGCTVEGDLVTDVSLPKSRLAVLQVIEYFRAFLIGRIGWSRMGSLIVISGAFGVFRRSVVEAAGGYWVDTHAEDLELVLRMHRYLRERGEPYRIEFVSDPVCWTEVPERFRALRSQRRRWHGGLAQALFRHRRLIGDRRYGSFGLVALPYFVVFELAAPLVEILGLPVVVAGVSLGLLAPGFLLAFLLLGVLLTVFVSISALALEEFSFGRNLHHRDAVRTFFFAVVEVFGYRQLVGVWNVLGLLDIMLRRHPERALARRGLGNGRPPASGAATPREGVDDGAAFPAP